MKKCTTCKQILPRQEFHKNKNNKDGLGYRCKACAKVLRAAQYQEKKEHELNRNRDWAARNYEYDRKTRSARAKRRYNEDPEHRLRHNLRKCLTTAVRRCQKAGSPVRDLGCSIPELMAYLEARFKEGMSWKNYGPYWEIDHIIPLSAFDLTDREQFLRAAHYSNLQPLTKEENQQKSDLLGYKPQRIEVL